MIKTMTALFRLFLLLAFFYIVIAIVTAKENRTKIHTPHLIHLLLHPLSS